MINTGRMGMAAVLVATVGLGLHLNAGVSDASVHGCNEQWNQPSESGQGDGDPAAPDPGGASGAALTEVFDNFDGPVGAPPDPDRWTVIEGKGWDRGSQKYTADNALLDGQGHLVLQAQRTDDGYTSGRVETRRKQSFGYGTLIVRMKMPAGKGLWPALWLMGDDEDVNPWPGAGEIDVVEQVSNPRKRYSSLHGPIVGVPDYLQKQIVGSGPDLSADFHDYWVIHKPYSIAVGIDAKWVYNKPFCLIMNLAVGGKWPGPPDDSTIFPASMLVDWVHWQPALG
jgi:beta-glucanase (GH16 family)